MSNSIKLLHVSSTCNLPLVDGQRIVLKRETFDNHMSKHPEIFDRVHDIEYALRSPDYVANSLPGPGGKNNGAPCFVRKDATPKGIVKPTNRTSFLHVYVKGDVDGPLVTTAMFSDQYHGDIAWKPSDYAQESVKDDNDLHASYDRDSDVLYIHVGAPVEAYSEGGQDGLILRYSIENESPCGVTVMSFSDWGEFESDLDKHVSAFLHVPPQATLKLLRTI